MNSKKRMEPPCVEQAASMLPSELRYGRKELHLHAHAPADMLFNSIYQRRSVAIPK